MSLHRSALSALVLFVAMPMVGGGAAEAKVRRIASHTSDQGFRLVIVDDGTASSATATLESDAGDEDLTLVESDAWLHGAAKVAALPKVDGTVTLSLYDSANASLMTFSGRFGGGGADYPVILLRTADATKDTCDASSKTGCTSETSTVDIEVLAAELFTAPGGYELGLDLAGSDTYAVAYASLSVTESDEVTTCSKETGACTTTGSTTTTTAEVDWDAIGAVWDAELSAEPEGILDVKVKTYDAKGERLGSAKAALGVPWIDGGEGVNVLRVDEDPLTVVGLIRSHDDFEDGAGGWSDRMAISSSGWTPSTAPVDAKVELTNGDTITIPVNSYQRVGTKVKYLKDLSFQTYHSISVSGVVYDEDSLADMTRSPVCLGGSCLMLVEDEDGDYDLSVSVYGTDAGKLADELDLTVTITDELGEKLYSETDTVVFDDDITAVFANDLSFSEDPIGLGLTGKVSLLGAANKNGKQETLAKGKFYGSFSRDGDGDLDIAGVDKDDVSSEGDIVKAGSAVALELTTDTNKDGVLNGPPAIAMRDVRGRMSARVDCWSAVFE